MTARRTAQILVALALMPLWACKVDNPMQPSVSFVAPRAQGPSNGTFYRFNDQPITLTIINAVRTGSATVSYTVDVALDGAFANVVFSRAGIPESPTGVTDVQIDPLAGDATYFWRSRAVVDGVAGVPAAVQHFVVRPEVIINTPTLESPAGGSSIFTARPNFTVRNSVTQGPVGTIFYEFEVADSSSFSGTPLTGGTIAQGSGPTTVWVPPVDLPEGTLFWRARGLDPSNDAESPWSQTATFEREFGIDLNQVVYIQSPNIANWQETAKISSAFHDAGAGVLCVFHSKLGLWPAKDFFDAGPILEGNQFIFANINGTWYGGASEWYRPGQACKAVDEQIGSDSFTEGPLSGWRPRPGEVFGIAATTPSRLYPSFATLDQRSDVVLIVW
ncbi:MAG TPA: hypothetical protein VMM93_04655 [Vicinamibacterales bacterium]|nr:hypothetical protein [Vicinamibacterales bacterium]